MISNDLFRKKVLDNAIHGTLVSNSIDKLKEKYLKYDCKNQLFDVPKSWKWVNLDSICDLIFSAPSPKYSKKENENYCLGQKNNQSYGLDMNGMKYCTDEFMSNYKEEYYLKYGDVLLNSLGTGSVGRIGFFNLEDKKYITDGHLFVFRPNEDFNPKFFFYIMKYFEKTFEYMAIGTTHQAFLKVNKLKEFEIPICPLEEQDRIVSKIDELLELIDKKEKNDMEVQKFKRVLKEKILDNAIHGALVKNDLSLKPVSIESITDCPFSLPNNWLWSNFDKMVIKISDGTHSTPKYKENGIPFLSVKDMSDGKLHFENCKYISKEEHDSLYKRCDPRRNDLLITKVGTTGVPVIVDTDEEFSIFVSVAQLRFDLEKLNLKYIKYVVLSKFVQDIISENTRGAANKNWVIKDIKKTTIPLPPLEEQKRIVEKIESLFELIEQL